MATINIPWESDNISLSQSKWLTSLVPQGNLSWSLGSLSSQWNTIYASSITASNIFGSLPSSSWASASISSSYAVTASYLVGSIASATSASYASTSSYAAFAVSAGSATSATSATSASYASTSSILSNQYFVQGVKTFSLLSSSYTTGLTINLSQSMGAYVKTTLCGTIWPLVGPVGYVSEYLLQKGSYDISSSAVQPGAILSEKNNNYNGNAITSQILDPGVSTGSANVSIQWINSGNNNIGNITLIYEVRGAFNSVS